MIGKHVALDEKACYGIKNTSTCAMAKVKWALTDETILVGAPYCENIIILFYNKS